MAAQVRHRVVSVDRWDAIFVGAGITSLACAALMLQRNPKLRLLMLDKHIVPGGYASVFQRPKNGAIFDCSLHKLSGMKQGGNLLRIIEALGLNKDLNFIYPDDYYHAHSAQAAFDLPNDDVALEASLYARFPTEMKGIKTFFDQVRTYGRNGYYQFQMMEGTFLPDVKELRYAHKVLKNKTVEQGINELVSDPLLREILAAPGIYVGGYPEDLGYLYYLHVVYATLNKGNAYVLGSSQNLSNTLAQRVIDHGGQVLLSTTVDELIVEADQSIKGVRSGENAYYAENVYINASPHYAMEAWLPQWKMKEAVGSRLEKLKPARSTTTTYLVTDRPAEEIGLPGTETMHFSTRLNQAANMRKAAESNGFPTEESEAAFWQASPMEITNYHALDPQGGNVVCLNVLDSMEHWPKRRTPPYREKKKRAIAIMIERLCEVVPEIRKHIVYQEGSTPWTYQRFTNNTKGSGYGAMVSTDLSGHGFHQHIDIKGLQFLSAWVAGPSYEAAFGYAEMMARKWPLEVQYGH